MSQYIVSEEQGMLSLIFLMVVVLNLPVNVLFVMYLTAGHVHAHIPRLLKPLPEGLELGDVWCGSEFTLVADSTYGSLWGCGWNEHGNLGVGQPSLPASTSSSSWEAVRRQPCAQTSGGRDNGGAVRVHLWEGSVGCGGGHVVVVAKNNE
jgi:hypothetical protein